MPDRAVPPHQRILVIDDEPVVCHSVRRVLGPEGHEVATTADSIEGLALALAGGWDLIVLDLMMPPPDGIEIFRTLRAKGVNTEVVVITGYAEVATAVEVMKLGATDYLCKPFTPDQLRMAVRRVGERSALLRENAVLRDELAARRGFRGMLGQSRAMEGVYELIRKVAPSGGTVLITGESGTGKEMVARALHELSDRVSGPFVPCDCSTLAPSLLESELFGHVKGSFSGAITTRKGLLEAAQGGTLFLDEVANIGLETQGKLLRALESHRIRRVGDTEERTLDLRLVAATNRDLRDLIARGSFREDLFYRLNVVPLELPPLRAREGDIPLLALDFLDRFAARTRSAVRGFTPEAMAALEAYPWPGNVRELKNTVERLAILCGNERIGLGDLSVELRASGSQPVDRTAPSTWEAVKEQKRIAQEAIVSDIERRFVLDALDRSGGNVSEAAREVGMQRPNFHALMRRHGIVRDS